MSKKMYKNTMVEMGLQTIALCTLSSSISAPRKKFSKKMPKLDKVELNLKTIF